MFQNEKNPVKVANRIVEENFNEMQPNITRRLLVTPVWELLAEYVDDANLGQRAAAKNVARLDRSWYTIH